MRNYETTFILNPEMEEDDREDLMERIKGIITAEGEINEVDVWGNRQLAYEINDQRTGFYAVIDFNSEPEVVDELERNLKIIDDVMRFLVVRKDK
ncbi:MAG: 30S ribosomal protein S6 [Halanaerobiaceae bacterium]